MKIHRDAVAGAVLVILAGFYFYGTRDLPPGRDEPGPAFFPAMLSGMLFVLGSILTVQGFKHRDTAPPDRHHRWTVQLAMVFTILYLAAFVPLGFVVSTWLYTLAITLTFRRDRALVPIVVPIVTTLLIYLLFDVGLGARLPAGFWGNS